MPKLFICYRRSDTQMVAGRLRDSLAKHLGERAIFRDKNTIAPGEDWTKAVGAALSGGAVVLALIGPCWLTARDDTGRRRLDDPADWNRIELERALERHNRVIPLLVDDARMPLEADLPDSLKALARSHALRLRDDDWDSDIERLVRALGAADAWSWARRAAVAAALLAVVLAAGVGSWWLYPGAQNRPEPDRREGGSTLRGDIREGLETQQNEALDSLMRGDIRAIGLVDDNLARIDKALQAFPDDVKLLVLAGYAAKNAYVSAKGFVSPEKRKGYLLRARTAFEGALKINPKDAGAVNGMGNVLFYEQRFDEAIRYHEQAISLQRGDYPAAVHDLNLVRQVKSGKVPFDP